MSFEWQDRDTAARTLGVDTATLQAWIDDGRAPSRTNQGRLQVLIEHLDEAAEEPGNHEKKNGTGTKQTASGDARAEMKDGEREAASGLGGGERVETRPAGTDLELVSKRELQLAGGMVAAWQRLAETSNQDLARARKVGTLSWSLVAALTVISGIGLWYSTKSVTDTEGRLTSTQEKLTDVQRIANDTQNRAAALQEEVMKRTQELAEANAKLGGSIERANLTKAQADQLVAQHLLTTQLAQKQADTSKALFDTVQATVEEQKQRLATLEKDLAAAMKREDELKKSAATREESIKEATTQREALKKQVDQLTSDHAKATTMIVDLQKQLTAMQAELDKTKTAKTGE